MRPLILFLIVLIIGLVAATTLVIDLREPVVATPPVAATPVAILARGDFLIRCRDIDGETVSHIVAADNAKIDESGTSGISIKGFRFAYSPGVPCTRHPITEEQLKQYYAASK